MRLLFLILALVPAFASDCKPDGAVAQYFGPTAIGEYVYYSGCIEYDHPIVGSLVNYFDGSKGTILSESLTEYAPGLYRYSYTVRLLANANVWHTVIFLTDESPSTLLTHRFRLPPQREEDPFD